MAREERKPRRDGGNPTPGYTDKTFAVNCDADSGMYLAFFMGNELAYYNHLVAATQPYMRSRPELVLSIRGQLTKLWGLSAEMAMRPIALLEKPSEEWPERFRMHRDLIMDRNLSSLDQLNFISTAGIVLKLHPAVRRNMATELLAYIQPQCEVIQASLKSNSEGLRSPLQMLNTHEKDARFSVQLLRNMVKITWDEQSKISKIATPYAPRMLTVADWDLSRPGWNTMVIRQNAAGNGFGESYSLSVMNTDNQYMLTWTDGTTRRIKRVY